MHSKIIFVLFISATFFSACKKDRPQYYNPVPEVTVNIKINIDNPAYIDLYNQGGYVYLDGGASGIILVHGYDDMYYALDRACPYHPNDACAKINMQRGNIYLVCGHYDAKDWIACCGSQYMLDGSLVKGPSEYPLKGYKVNASGSLLSITNY